MLSLYDPFAGLIPFENRSTWRPNNVRSVIDEKRSLRLPYSMDIKDDVMTLAVDVPGIAMKDINVEFKDGYLTISAVRDDLERKVVIQRDEFDFLKASATLDLGVLTITAPKKEDRLPVKIKVKTK